jgi:radical SAM superfamily enzyme YgiQ (UPF0313 family)
MKNLYLVQMSLSLPGSKFRHIPYSVGLLWSYASQFTRITDNYDLKGILFNKEPTQSAVQKIEDPDVIGVSIYTWNYNYSIKLIEEVKRQYPDCTVIVGGPGIPNDPDKAKVFMRTNPEVDFMVHHEGEVVFTDLLDSLLDPLGLDHKDIPSIVYRDDHQIKQNTGSGRIDDLGTIPSPYLTGVFDDLINEYKNNTDIVLNGVMETNRGCPFQCTFCDWGGLTFQKLKKFDIDRVKKEIAWFGVHEVEMIVNADANFGIFKDRDLRIAEHIVSTNKQFGYPKMFDTNYNKNNSELVLQIANTLSTINRRFTVALQSTHEPTLNAIKRGNLETSDLDKILEIAKRNNVVVSTELITGLPLETLDSWKQGIATMIEKGIMVEALPLSLLENSEMNDPAYRAKYGMITHNSELPFGSYVPEYQDVITSTSTISHEEMAELWMFNWITNSMHSLGFTHLISRYMHDHHGISYIDFYDQLLTDFRNDSVLSAITAEFEVYAMNHNYVNFYITSRPEWLTYINNHRRDLMDVLVAMCHSMIRPIDPRIMIRPIDPRIHDLLIYQFMKQATNKKPVAEAIEFKYNWDHWERTGELEHKQTNILFEHPGMGNFYDFENFIAYTRRNSGWMVKTSEVLI